MPDSGYDELDTSGADGTSYHFHATGTGEDCLPPRVRELVTRTLRFYANRRNWAKDDWGVRAVLRGFFGGPKKKWGGYGQPERPARAALDALEVRRDG